jgi:hypothetical protein
MCAFIVARFGRLVGFDGPENVGVTDPPRYGLGAESVEAAEVAEGQMKLTGYSLVAR